MKTLASGKDFSILAMAILLHRVMKYIYSKRFFSLPLFSVVFSFIVPLGFILVGYFFQIHAQGGSQQRLTSYVAMHSFVLALVLYVPSVFLYFLLKWVESIAKRRRSELGWYLAIGGIGGYSVFHSLEGFGDATRLSLACLSILWGIFSAFTLFRLIHWKID